MVKILLDESVHLNLDCHTGSPFLHAVKHGSLVVVEAFLTAGADIRHSDYQDQSSHPESALVALSSGVLWTSSRCF